MLFFFFQAEDGIRDKLVTGVQTCALPISGATERIGFSGRWSNPIGHLAPRTETSLAAWAVEGRAGVALSVDRSLRRHLGFGADPHVGFDVLWMATTDLGYLDRRLWDDAGTVEAGPLVAATVGRGRGGRTGRTSARGREGYRDP